MIRSIVLAAALCVGTASVGAAQACRQPGGVQQVAASLANLTNRVRQEAGRQALNSNRDLAEAAQVLACDIAATGRISHESSAGLGAMDRATRAGYRGCLVAENLAWGYPRPETIVNGWLASPGHNRNLMHPRVADFGIGIAQGNDGPVWVMIYARSC